VTIEIRGIPDTSALHAQAARRTAAALVRLPVPPTRARVAFFDDNGPRGGRDTRCAVTVRLPRQPELRVEETAGAPREAFDAALATLERQLERLAGRRRDSRRHPKKYFTAKRLLEAGLPPDLRTRPS
jgi:ribosome-associated translation inhibitor RaiA